ncbi:MAG: hypothetical protein JNG88_11255 [Phycisphaerales bacterium]|nr:hypothetical protein [Phycisphaerales bacterium]
MEIPTLAAYGKVDEAESLSREALDMNLHIDPTARFNEMLTHQRGIVLAACGDFDAAQSCFTGDEIFSNLANWTQSYHVDFHEVFEKGAAYFRSKGNSALAEKWQATADAGCE